jgi:hypothetical protein
MSRPVSYTLLGFETDDPISAEARTRIIGAVLDQLQHLELNVTNFRFIQVPEPTEGE